TTLPNRPSRKRPYITPGAPMCLSTPVTPVSPSMRPNALYGAVHSCATRATAFRIVQALGADPIHTAPCLTLGSAWSRMRRHHPPRCWHTLQDNSYFGMLKWVGNPDPYSE